MGQPHGRPGSANAPVHGSGACYVHAAGLNGHFLHEFRVAGGPLGGATGTRQLRWAAGRCHRHLCAAGLREVPPALVRGGSSDDPAAS